MLIFTYGTLKRGYPNNYLFSKCKFLREGITVEKFNMVTYMKINFPLVTTPIFEPDIELAKPIIGEIYKISTKVLKKLDILENYPKMYNRELKQIKTLDNNKVYNAYMYLFQSQNYKLDNAVIDNSNVYNHECGYFWY